MGRPKLLLPWGATTVIGHLIQQWSEAGAAQTAVVRASDPDLPGLSQMNVGSIVNPAPERGMFSSITCAAHWDQWKPGITHWVISLGDQPHLRGETLERLVAAAGGERRAIWQPARRGRRRHPVVLPRSAFQRLRVSQAPDLKAFLEASPEPRRSLELDDEGLDVDMDTPADYERALKIAGLG